ncbi:hypothetical protein KGA66_09100 [Actinocrinis puniceicyclus]|uniref:Uncharacterized protein n=1 Tax=Actinocrinis puniceicyclus TaxID=977794 RepID=A0A8J8BCK0_9ACTN|nr:hypothetical protein [Actinocrinis puniceicyclus]MBS2963201.1 hypothetical protein [Actinocrinis puniceicyclus]
MRDSGAGKDADEPDAQVTGSSELVSRPRYEPVEWLTEVLELETGGYEPDTQRIRTMVRERLDGGVGARGRGTVLKLRLAGVPTGIVAAALCATVAVGVTATVEVSSPDTAPNAAARHSSPPAVGGGGPAASGTSHGESPSAPGRASQSGQAAQSATQTATQTAGLGQGAPSAAPSSSAATATGSAPLTATGSVAPATNASWSEQDVSLDPAEPLSALQLIVRVTPTPGLTPDSYWSNHDITAFDVKTVAGSDGGLVYTFTLKQGTTLPAKPFVIAVQFRHTGAHDPGGDTFSVSVTTDQAHGSAPATVQGTF